MWNEATIKEFWRNNESTFAGDENAAEIYRLTRKYVSGKVLDIGAGSGALMSLIPNCKGIDIEPRHPKVQEASVCGLPFAGETFDTVYASDILEHLTDDMLERGLTEISRVLKPKGILIIIIPYREKLGQSLVYCPNCKAKFHRWGHVQVFDEARVGFLLAHYGFIARKMKLVRLSLMAKSPLVRYFWWFIMQASLIKPTDMIVVAEKC